MSFNTEKSREEQRKAEDSSRMVMAECPFCGATMEQCDESPIYGQTALHPEADCWLSKNMICHARLVELWNKRKGE